MYTKAHGLHIYMLCIFRCKFVAKCDKITVFVKGRLPHMHIFNSPSLIIHNLGKEIIDCKGGQHQHALLGGDYFGFACCYGLPNS